MKKAGNRQFGHLQEQNLRRLQALIPSGCPLRVEVATRGFRAVTLDECDQLTGRFQVVHAFVSGYVASWERVRPVMTNAVSTITLPPGSTEDLRAASRRRMQTLLGMQHAIGRSRAAPRQPPRRADERARRPRRHPRPPGSASRGARQVERLRGCASAWTPARGCSMTRWRNRAALRRLWGEDEDDEASGSLGVRQPLVPRGPLPRHTARTLKEPC